MMKQITLRLAALVLALLLAGACTEERPESLTIHLVGDSTMADKPDPDHNPERGWGQMLPAFFDEAVTVRNHATNGRSTRSFIDEGKWDRVMEALAPGDYVFIQFGHNDAKAYDPNRYSNPWSAYRRQLEAMVRETRAAGGHPVLLSPIVRRHFNEEGTLTDSHGPYPFVARMVAESEKVPFIDLQQMTEDMVSGLGPQRSARHFMILEPGAYDMYPEGRQDNTHLRVSGAREVAGMAVRAIRALGLPLAKHLKTAEMKARVLTVVGGHSYDTIEFHAMLEGLDDFYFDSISQPDASVLLASEHVYSYDAILFYDFITDMPLRDSAIYLNLARRGMPMLFLHHAICSFQGWEGYASLIGGKYLMEGEGVAAGEASTYRHDLDLDIRITDPSHPVTKGLDDFTIHDEAYGNLWVSEHVTPLLTTEHPDCTPTVGWVNQFRQSTSIWLIFGHDKQAYENASFRQLLNNGLHWLTAEE